MGIEGGRGGGGGRGEDMGVEQVGRRGGGMVGRPGKNIFLSANLFQG
jgi:hypothetical protein